MAYLGYQPATGANDSFKVLDDIKSYTLTFDGSSSSVVSAADDTITSNEHRFVHGQKVTYNKGGGTKIGGLDDGSYYIIFVDKNTIKLSASSGPGDAVNITGVGAGTAHTLNVAFDGVNTKFKPTYDSGTTGQITRAAQLVISLNGVIQQPVDSASPSSGFGLDSGNIVFSEAPTTADTFWGHILTKNLASFEVSDNKVDNFTGNGSATEFTLSKSPANSDNVIVTIDGVVQYPSTSGNTRAYQVNDNSLVFSSAPANGAAIQARHIGFAGAVPGTSGVTGFYGRTGNVALVNTDNIVANDATFSGNVSIAKTLTYDDVTNIDSVGIVTARLGIQIPNDTYKLRSGQDLEMQVFHNGSNSIIKDTRNDGKVRIQADNFDIRDKDDSQTMISAGVDASVSLSHSGNQKLQTISTGVSITGNVGINETSPQTALHIGSGGTFRFERGDGTRYGELWNDNSFVELKASTDPIRLNAQSYIRFDIADSEKLRIDSNGSLLIGGTSSSGATEKLRIENDSATSDVCQVTIISGNAERAILNFGDAQDHNIGRVTYDNTDNHMSLWTDNNERLRITSTGEVGIGTNNPGNFNAAADNLIVGTGVGHNGITINSAADGDGWLVFNDAPNTTLSGAIQYNHVSNYMAFRTGGATNEDRLRINSDGKLLIDRTVSSTTGNHPALEIETICSGSEDSNFATGIDFKVDGVHKKRLAVTDGTGEGGGDWIFYRDNGTNEALRIASNGRVGINSTVPTAPLNAQAETSTGICLRLNQEPTDKRAYIQFQDYATTGTDSYILNEGYDLTVYGGYGGKLNLGAYDTTGITVRSTGKVGVGTDNPSTIFVVSNDGAEGLEISHASGTVEANAYNRSGSARSPFEITAKTFKMSTGNPSLNVGLCQDSDGLVGINNDSPATVLDIKSTKNSDGLTVTKGSNVAVFLGHNGSGDEGLLHLKDGGTITTQIYGETGQVSFFNAGHVGIGTDNPAKLLDVHSTNTNTYSSSDSNTPNAGAVIQLTNKAGTDGSGSGYYSSIKFSIANGATSTGYLTYHRTGDNQGDFTFKSRNAASTYPELMRIRSNGNIGIKNSAPLYPLHFKTAMGSSPSWIHMEVTGTNTVGGGGGIAFDTSASNNASNNGLFLATVSGERSSSDDGSNNLVFKTSKSNVNGDDGNASTPKTAMKINENQVVNIPSLNNSRGLELNPGSNAGSLVFDRNGTITSFIRASDGTSNVGGGSGGGSRMRLGKNQIHFDTFPHVTNVGDAVTYTERLTIDSSGYVGINEASPSSYYSKDLVLKCAAAEGGMTIRSNDTTDTNYVMFADGTSGNEKYRGYIAYHHNNGTSGGEHIQLGVAGNTRVYRFYSDGLSIGGETDTSSTNNRLDDYEEGSWTPANQYLTITNNTTATYTKIGRLVTLQFDCTYASSAADTAQVGGIIEGLPFQPESTDFHFTPTWLNAAGNAIGDNESYNFLSYVEGSNNNRIIFYSLGNGCVAIRAQTASKRVRGTVTYMTSA